MINKEYTIKSYFKSPEGLRGKIKAPIIWGNAKEKNSIMPLVYLTKPKWMCEESWKTIVDAVELNLPKNTVIKENQNQQ